MRAARPSAPRSASPSRSAPWATARASRPAADSHRRIVGTAAPFYGPFPDGGDLRGTKAAVLANYGGLDDRVNATMPAAQAAMEAARLEHAIVVYGGANHAFFNDTGNNFNPAAMAEAYRRVLDWYDRFVARGHDRH